MQPLLIFISCALNFALTCGLMTQSNHLSTTLSQRCLYTAVDSIPTTEKARLKVICSGKSIDSALFRAELKKELTFFRGCSCIYQYNPNLKELQIIGEGKTIQLSRFLEWLKYFTTDFTERKPSFQGPPIVIKIERSEWDSYSGEIKGFQATEDAPMLSDGVPSDGSQIEAKNMAGTDESV